MSNVGFDPRRIRDTLEGWLLENFACPLNLESWAWPAGRSACVEELVCVHAGEHGVPALGRSASVPDAASAAALTAVGEEPWTGSEFTPISRCPRSRCKVCGVAYALLEVYQFFAEAKSASAAELRRLEKHAASVARFDVAGAANLRTRANAVRATLKSPAFAEEPTGGRPGIPLAVAVAQHLSSGGFTDVDVAKLLGTTAEAVRKRVVRKVDTRSLVPFEDADTVGS
jgi:hypothetical protein